MEGLLIQGEVNLIKLSVEVFQCIPVQAAQKAKAYAKLIGGLVTELNKQISSAASYAEAVKSFKGQALAQLGCFEV